MWKEVPTDGLREWRWGDETRLRVTRYSMPGEETTFAVELRRGESIHTVFEGGSEEEALGVAEWYKGEYSRRNARIADEA